MHFRYFAMNATSHHKGQYQSASNPSGSTSIVEQLAEEMVARWRQGERPLTEQYLDRFPHLQQRAEAVLELVAEELALREEYGELVSLAELNERFPDLQAQLRALVQCQRTLGPRTPLFPSSGDVLGDFQLLSELGRGAQARVYLASQPSLGDRLVVLKLGPDTGHEHLSLAKLQHTHIVPLYSVHEFPAHGLRGLCLPYFGGATLSEVLSRLRPRGQTVIGSDILAAIHRDGTVKPATPPDSLAWESLKFAAFSEVVCWIGACLADALQYAHDRGLLHLDLKPSNVLLASDGVPMLLDFHLARPPLRAGDSAPFWLGGTPAYMAPEHLAAVQSVRDGTTIPEDLDARADVYSLGIVLREALANTTLDRRGSSPSIGLADILARCTATNPKDRYPTAIALANDLRRQLANQSLRGVPNRSFVELWRKWRRRSPHSLTLILTLSALLVAFGGWTMHTGRLANRADAALREGQTQLTQGRFSEAIEAFRNGEMLTEGLPFHRDLRSQLREFKLTAERGQAAVELHQVCEQIRPLYAADLATSAQSQVVEKRCRELWDQRETLAIKLQGQKSPEMDRQWRMDLLDLAILSMRLQEQSALSAAKQVAHRDALITLEQAESLLGASAVLDLERARHEKALGLYSAAEQATAQAQAHPPASAWDHLVVGRFYLSAGDVRRAMGEMDRCLQREPQSLWAHYYKGVCCLRLGHPIEAVAEFSACMALSPNVPWCIHNLGQAYSEAEELELALACFDRALALDPSLSASFVGRATIYLRKGRYADALADLRSAADGGIPLAEVEYRKALVYLASGERSAAIASLRSCLERDPRHIQAQETLAKITAGR
jgi:serine/threonine protein kinase/tetratricopeptide (TPR) repeat protein